MSKSILYIGNNLSKKSKYSSAMNLLSALLIKESFNLILSSDKKSKALRLIDMCFSVIKYRNKVDYVLIDTFSTSNFYYAFICSQFARLFKIKYIPILHGGNLPNRIANSPKMSKLIFTNSYNNISPSGYLKFEFEKKGYQTAVIPNIIELDSYKFKVRKNLKPHLLYVRAFAEIYNPIMALHVLKELRKMHIDAKLCMIGPDRDGILEEFKRKVEALELENYVEITGVLSKENWHKKSEEFDIFINTTNIDNTPVSVIEAMALGLPVISTNVGGIPYLISHEENGLLVQKNDIAAMVEFIEELLANKHEKISLNARKYSVSFDSKEVIKQWKLILN